MQLKYLLLSVLVTVAVAAPVANPGEFNHSCVDPTGVTCAV